MKKYTITIIPFLCYAYAIAQSITPIVVSSADNFVRHPNFSVSSTLGDFMTQTFTGSQTTNDINSPSFLYGSEKHTISVTAYPNPAVSTLNISISSNPQDKFSMELWNAFGQKIRVVNNMTGNTYKLDVSKYATGIYFLRIISDNSDFQQTIHFYI